MRWPLPLSVGVRISAGVPRSSFTAEASISAFIAKAEPVSRWHHVQWQA